MHIKGTEHKHSLTTPSKPLPQPALVHHLPPKAIIPPQICPEGTIDQDDCSLFHICGPGLNGIEVSLSPTL